jgi:hypothetical protein
MKPQLRVWREQRRVHARLADRPDFAAVRTARVHDEVRAKHDLRVGAAAGWTPFEGGAVRSPPVRNRFDGRALHGEAPFWAFPIRDGIREIP